LPGYFDGKNNCVYHFRVAGHDTENCFTLKDKIEALIKEGVIQLKGAPPNVNSNPLPNYGGAHVNMITVDEECNLDGTIVSTSVKERVKTLAFVVPIVTIGVRAPIVEVLMHKPTITALVAHTPSLDTKSVPWNYSTDARNKGKEKIVVEAATVGMTRSGSCYAPEGVVQGMPNRENSQKKVVTEAEVKDFWRKMPTKEYSVEELLKKTPAQISLLALLMTSATHRSALVKVLNEAHVPTEITSKGLSALVG